MHWDARRWALVLEEMEMEPFVQDVERFANGKRSRYLVLMDGEMVSGCATGKTA